MPSIAGGRHIALTVTDADRSAEWYNGLLRLSVLLAADDETVQVPGARRPRVWMGRAALDEWERELSTRGIKYTPIAETATGSVMVVRDPDNIQLEFWLPAGS